MIILAFPGLGKTTLAKLRGGFVDLDYEWFRRSSRDLGLSEDGLIRLYARVAKCYAKAGYIVLINELGVLKDASIRVDRLYYPDGEQMERQCAIKLGVDMKTLWSYQFDWMTAGLEHEIRMIPCTGNLAGYLTALKPKRR